MPLTPGLSKVSCIVELYLYDPLEKPNLIYDDRKQVRGFLRQSLGRKEHRIHLV